MTPSRFPHILAFSRRRRPRLTWRDVPNLLAVGAFVWIWMGLNWVAWAWVWSVVY